MKKFKDLSNVEKVSRIANYAYSEKRLMQIINSEDSSAVRLEAIKHLRSSRNLLRAIKTEKTLYVKQEAARLLTDENCLMECVQDYDLSSIVIKKLSNKEKEKLAMYSPKWYLRLEAVKSIENKELVTWISCRDKDECVRDIAKKRIKALVNA